MSDPISRSALIQHNEGEDTMSYTLDLFEGKDYSPDDDLFEVITKTIDEIMEVMPR